MGSQNVSTDRGSSINTAFLWGIKGKSSRKIQAKDQSLTVLFEITLVRNI